MPNSSESLFPTSERDVKHSMETVQQRWGAEQKRRRKKALLIVVPIIIVFIVGCVTLLNSLGGVSQLGRLFTPPVREPEPEIVPQKGIGNPEAKIIIKYYPQFASEELTEFLNRIIDSKPSEFYLESKDASTLTPEQKEEMKANLNCDMTINNKYTFEVKLPGKKKKTLDLRDPYIDVNTQDEMCQLITDIHTEIYGKPLVPIFTFNEEYFKKLAEDEAKHKAAGHDHDHNHDDDEEETKKVKPTPVNLDNLPDIKQIPEN